MTEVTAQRLRQLEAAQQITHVGSWERDLATGVVTWSDEMYRIYGLEPRSQDITLEWFLGRVHPDDRDRVRAEVEQAIAGRGAFSHRERIVRPDGTVRAIEAVGEVITDAAGTPITVIGTCRDITEQLRLEAASHRTQRLHAEERRALEMLAAGAPLDQVLEVIVRLIEELSPGTIASILLLDPTGKRLAGGTAPGLPDSYNRALVSAPIGPKAGSCGTAAFRREAVFVADIETDPLWDDYRELARAHGLRACWSTPIIANDGRVLGTFALYYREPRVPDAEARELIARATHVAGIAIERRELDDTLRALSDRIEAVREEERTGIAREIHDVLGQALTALKLDIAWISRRVPSEPVGAKLTEMSRATDRIIAAVRRISSELRPGILDQFGLSAAIEWQADEFAQRTGTPCEVHSEIGDLQVAHDLATAVFRIFQEALTNIARHAGATRVRVRLGLERGQLLLEVIDDGVGLPEGAAANRSLGLLGMRERARRLGGTCEVRRCEPAGTVVSVAVPLKFPADHDRPEATGPHAGDPGAGDS